MSRWSISHIYGISGFGKRLSRKSDNVVGFPYAFHIAVQQPFKPLWSRLLLYELKPSRASFALCFKSLLMTLLPSSVLVSLFVWRLPFDLSSKGGPASSYTTAGTTLRVTDVLKTPHHDKVEISTCVQMEEELDKDAVCHKFCLTCTANALPRKLWMGLETSKSEGKLFKLWNMQMTLC